MKLVNHHCSMALKIQAIIFMEVGIESSPFESKQNYFFQNLDGV